MRNVELEQDASSRRNYTALFNPRRLGLGLPFHLASSAAKASEDIVEPEAVSTKREAEPLSRQARAPLTLDIPIFRSPFTNPSPFSVPLPPKKVETVRRRRRGSGEERALAANRYKAIVALETATGKRRKSIVDVEDMTEGLEKASVAERRRSALTPLNRRPTAASRAQLFRTPAPGDDLTDSDFAASPPADSPGGVRLTFPLNFPSPSGVNMPYPLVFPSRPTSIRSTNSLANLSSLDAFHNCGDDDDGGEESLASDDEDDEDLTSVVAEVLERSAAATRVVPSFASPFPPPFLSNSRRTYTADSFSKLTFPAMPTLFPNAVGSVPGRRVSAASSYRGSTDHHDGMATPSTVELRRSPLETGMTIVEGNVFAEAFAGSVTPA
ncbi:hypothetical protein Rhopal_003717-T1 [Rhodotorula paludigena]|uniref:Uncharacterized protein n=1 Tax=Rhodotorula paludigena TaxID=86838 RepID=A0AAV5GKH4_9BASI|nr:hypothetical protein Rhopal_003717-T1 [Rhodotorula paludigena]